MSSSTTHEATATATDDDEEESETFPTTAIRSSSRNANDKENNIVRMASYHEHEEGKHDADASTINNDMIMNYPIHVQQPQQRCEDDRGEEEYERAVRRALTENEYVKQINSQLPTGQMDR